MPESDQMPDSILWTDTYHVRSYETDASGRAAPWTLCNYLQETASRHADALAFSFADTPGTSWVLSRLRIALTDRPVWRAPVKVRTWPCGLDGLHAYRAFEICTDEGTILGRAMSAWLVFDLRRRRPQRLPAALHELSLPDHPLPLPLASDKLDTPSDLDRLELRTARRSDADVNQHTNNVSYVRWALDAVPGTWHKEHQLTHLDVDYRGETTPGDQVIVHAHAQEKPPVLHHRLVRADDERDAALVRTRWAPIS